MLKQRIITALILLPIVFGMGFAVLVTAIPLGVLLTRLTFRRFSGPVIAMILFIMPVVAIYKVEALARFRHRWVNGFILLTGALAVSALLFSLLK